MGLRVTPFDASGASHLTGHAGRVRRLAMQGAGVTVLSQGLGLAVQVIGTVLLARLLTPADFGVVTMVSTFSLLLTNFGLNGFTEAILQREEINHALASNLFWISVGAGLTLTIGFGSAGSLLARFYRDPLVTRVAVAMSLGIFITSASVVQLALLKRSMRFLETSTNEIIARTISLAVSVLLGWMGWGYWALVAGTLILPLCVSSGTWYLCRWIPGRPRRVAGTASMVQFAMHVYGRFFVNYGARNMDNALVGWRFDAQALGFYKKAYDLFALTGSLLVSSLSVVAVSALSRISRDRVNYRRYVVNALAVMAFVGMGLGADLTLVGKDVIRVLLGPGWEPAGRIFMFFGPGLGVMLLYGAHGWIHLSIGRADRWFRWGGVEFAFTVILFVVALPWGAAGIAVAWTASFWILIIPAFWYAGQPVGFPVSSMLGAVWKYMLASLLAGGASALIMRATPFLYTAPTTLGALVRVVSVSALFGALYLGLVVLLYGGVAPFSLMARLFREMVPRAGLSRPSPAGAQSE
jgi:O-antigen/teichoic acid export membrane protein